MPNLKKNDPEKHLQKSDPLRQNIVRNDNLQTSCSEWQFHKFEINDRKRQFAKNYLEFTKYEKIIHNNNLEKIVETTICKKYCPENKLAK